MTGVCLVRTSLCVAAAAVLIILPAGAQSPAAQSADGTSGNLLNPNISVVGWAQAEWGDEDVVAETFSFKEAEVGFQAFVDPYLKAEYYIAFSPDEGVELEEAFMTFLGLPRRLGLKAGLFRSSFGRFNSIHPPETVFADRPPAAERFFGEEGLAVVGLSGSFLVPNPMDVYLNVDVEVSNAPSGHHEEEAHEGEGEAAGAGEAHDEIVVFEAAGPRDLMALARLAASLDFGDATTILAGGTYANGSAGEYEGSPGTTEVRRNQLVGADLTLRWKNPRRAIYRSLTWTTEGVLFLPDDAFGDLPSARGIFSFVDYQFARRWHAGVRGDWVESLDGVGHESGGLAYVAFTPSEFSRLSIQGRHMRLADGETDQRLFMKLTTSIGPHGGHPF